MLLSPAGAARSPCLSSAPFPGGGTTAAERLSVPVVAVACQRSAGGFCVAVPLIPGWPASCQRERRNVQRHVRRAGVCLLRLGIILNHARFQLSAPSFPISKRSCWFHVLPAMRFQTPQCICKAKLVKGLQGLTGTVCALFLQQSCASKQKSSAARSPTACGMH